MVKGKKPLTQKQRDFIQSTMLTSKDVLIVDEAGMASARQRDQEKSGSSLMAAE